MAEVSWQARRTQDSVLVDVTADIEGSVGAAPIQNPIAGGEQTIRLLGPYRVTYEDEDLAPAGGYEQIVRVGEPLAAGTLAIAWAVVVDSWNNIGANQLGVLDVYGPHGAGADTPGLLGELVNRFSLTNSYGGEGGASGYGIAVEASGNAYSAAVRPLWFVCRDPLQVTVKINYGDDPGTPSAGSLDVYILTAETAA